MKKITIPILVIASALSVLSATPKPLPPCKWAGRYLGISNPTSWGKYVTPQRSVFEVYVYTNYTFTAYTLDFDLNYQTTFKGTISSTGAFKGTNQYRSTASGVCGAKGTFTGSFVVPMWNEIGTITAYREAVLP